MTQFFKIIGIITCIAAAVYTGHYLYTQNAKILDTIFHYAGIVAVIGVLLFVVLRIVYGKRWMVKVGANTFLGEGLMGSGKKLLNEVQDKNVQSETLTEVGVHVFWRLTRIGLLAMMVALIPVVLLFNQNRLIDEQNKLFTHQNKRIDEQTTLLRSQNEKLQSQNELFLDQNDLFTDQNIKVDKQTELVGQQTKLFNEQNKLARSQNNLLRETN